MFLNHARQFVGQWDGRSPSLCPQCAAPLVPRRGDWVRWHWAHYPSTHTSARCAYEESAWHMRWKQIYLTLGWQIEVPIAVRGTRFILDAMNPKTGRIREFVHSLSPAYLVKHSHLVQAGYDILWIFDGHEFISARARIVAKGGKKHYLKPLAYDTAHYLNVLVHDYQWGCLAYQDLWREWKKNIWFPIDGDHSKKLLELYLTMAIDQGVIA